METYKSIYKKPQIKEEEVLQEQGPYDDFSKAETLFMKILVGAEYRIPVPKALIAVNYFTRLAKLISANNGIVPLKLREIIEKYFQNSVEQ